MYASSRGEGALSCAGAAAPSESVAMRAVRFSEWPWCVGFEYLHLIYPTGESGPSANSMAQRLSLYSAATYRILWTSMPLVILYDVYDDSGIQTA